MFSHTSFFSYSLFFFNDTATTEIYTLSLHDALPISTICVRWTNGRVAGNTMRASARPAVMAAKVDRRDRKSTRLNSSHGYISYAVFCLKKKKAALDPKSADQVIRISEEILARDQLTN